MATGNRVGWSIVGLDAQVGLAREGVWQEIHRGDQFLATPPSRIEADVAAVRQPSRDLGADITRTSQNRAN